MKRIVLTFILIFTIIIATFSQENEIYVKNLNGSSFEINQLVDGQKNQPVIFFTWAKEWCWPCVKALDQLNNDFIELQENYDLKVIALNLDSNYTRQEIKDFVNDRGWNFDVYVDSEKNYMTSTNTKTAPVVLLAVNNKVISKKAGFIDGISNPETTSDYFIEIVNDLHSNVMYYDENWNNTTRKYATYIRYRNKIDEKYEVTDRWITGEIQMRGNYSDFWCNNKTGEFKYYNKDGTLSSSETF
jgi:peroxiredoxin